MQCQYRIDSGALSHIRSVFEGCILENPNSIMVIGWGAFSKQEEGLLLGMYTGSEDRLPEIFYFEDVPICFTVPRTAPRVYQGGIIAFQDNALCCVPCGPDPYPGVLISGVRKFG